MTNPNRPDIDRPDKVSKKIYDRPTREPTDYPSYSVSQNPGSDPPIDITNQGTGEWNIYSKSPRGN